MTDHDDLTWEPPGPGSWEMDEAHQQRPHPVVMIDWFEDAYAAGFRRGMALIGSPLDTIALRCVNGWGYVRPVPLGERQGPPPPKAVFAVLFRLVPELRRRLRTARSVYDARPWRAAVADWEREGRPRADATHARFRAVDVAAATDAELADHLGAIQAALADAIETHFAHAALTAAAIGRFLVRTEQLAGISGDRAFEMLAGYSPATAEPLAYLDLILADLDPAETLVGDAHAVLARIEAGDGTAAQATRAYLERFGDNVVGGLSPLDATLREVPDVIVGSLRARRGHPQPEPRIAADALAQDVRATIPAADRPEWDQLLADAREVTSLRDDDVGAALRLLGRARLGLLEAGRRLHERGLLDHPEAVVDITTAEIGALLCGAATSTDADAARAARLAATAVRPPSRLGEAAAPPPVDRFPAPVREVTEAVFAYVGRLHVAPPADDGLTGVGIGQATATGVARVVHDTDDLVRVEPGDVLVTAMTSPTFNAAIAMSSAIVCDHGGTACHAAIMAREFDIPAVVGTGRATSVIPDGAPVSVDAAAGVVTLES